MLATTLGVVLIVVGGLLALALLEGIVLYASFHPTWKTGRGSSRDGLHEFGELEIPAGQGRETGAGGSQAAAGVSQAGAGDSEAGAADRAWLAANR